MAVQPLARENWHRFLEDFARHVRGFTAGVEILSCDFGDQRLAEKGRCSASAMTSAAT